MAKSWREKYLTRTKPEVKLANFNFADVRAGEEMLISTPAEIEAELRALPEGCELTITELRKRLAAKHETDKTCPITTGIFLHIVAETALEDLHEGKPLERVAPFWRVISPESRQAKKLSCGIDVLKDLRACEHLPV